MRTRRYFLLLAGAGACSVALRSFAQQQGRVWRIGYLDPRTPSTSAEYYASFVRGMRELGYSEGRNVSIEQKFSEGNQERLRRLAAEFVRSKVDVIVTDSSLAVRAAMEATTTIPIVAAVIADPVSAGFARSLARPGANVTGFSNMSEELVAKRLEMLVTAVPAASRIGFLFNPLSDSRVPNVQAAGKTSGRSIVLARASTPQEIDSAFAQMLRESVSALIVGQDGFLSSQASRIAGLALRQRLPSIGGRRQIAEAGILLSYGVDYVDMFHRAATHVDKILKGARPGDLPIERATKFEFVVNMRTAKALGITIPQSVLVQATQMIE